MPEDKDPSKEYSGDKFITCIPVMTQVKKGEPLKIKALIMGDAENPVLFYRNLGKSSFQSIDMDHDSRGVYRSEIPGQEDDFEWYVSASTSLGAVVFPATAEEENSSGIYQTVVVLE